MCRYFEVNYSQTRLQRSATGNYKVAFVNTYTVNAFECCSLCLNCRTNDMTGKDTIVQHTNTGCRFYTNIIYATLCQLSLQRRVRFYD